MDSALGQRPLVFNRLLAARCSDFGTDIGVIEIDELVLRFRQGIQPYLDEIILKNSTVDRDLA